NCARNDVFHVDDVAVTNNLPDLTVRSLRLVCTSAPGCPASAADLNAPGTVLQRALDLYPGGERVSVEPFSADVDINWAVTRPISDTYCSAYKDDSQPLRSCHMALVTSAINSDWWQRDSRNRQGYNLLLGVHRYEREPGWQT